MPTIFLSGAVGAVLAVLALIGGASVWTALAIYSLGGAFIALSALAGALLTQGPERPARRPAPLRVAAGPPARRPARQPARRPQTRGISQTVS